MNTDGEPPVTVQFVDERVSLCCFDDFIFTFPLLDQRYIQSTLKTLTLYLLCHTKLIEYLCSKMLNHDLNPGLFLSLLKFFG